LSSLKDDGEADVMLNIEALSAGYGKQLVLNNLDLSIDEGERVCLLGHNGAGKSTLLRCVSQLMKPFSGGIQYRGESTERWSPAEAVAHGMALIPQGRELFPNMSVYDNVRLGALILGKQREAGAWATACERWPWLSERSQQRASSLSGGQQQMVAVARGLASAPRLLLVDEPSLGLSGASVADLADELLNVCKQGTTLILAEQNVGLALRVCERFVVLRESRIIGDFTRDHLPSEGLWTLF
jgi:branched-chain amino acid transport system ATP-binding protein